MLQNAYFLGKIGADTAENEQHFAEILPKLGGVPNRCPAPKEGRGAPRGRDRGPLAVRGEQRRLHPGAGEEEQAAGLRDRPGLRRAERPRVLGRGQPRGRAAMFFLTPS